MTKSHPRRRGAAVLESAMLLPVVVLLLAGLIVGGFGVFHQQQLLCMAQEAARFASVHGAQRSFDTDDEPATADGIRAAAVVPLAAGMDPAAVAVRVQLVRTGPGTVEDWDASRKEAKSLNANGEYVTNFVRVTVTYTYDPGFLLGPVPMGRTAEFPMSH